MNLIEQSSERQTGLSDEERAKALAQKAMERFEAILSDHFRDKHRLVFVFEQFDKAIHLAPQAVSIHCQKAYCLLNLGALDLAAQVLQTALHLDAQNEEAQRLHTALLDLQKPDPFEIHWAEIEAFQSYPYPRTSSEFDQLYDDCDEFIQSQLHFLLQTSLSPEVRLDPEQSEAYYAMIQCVNKINQAICKQLKILATEFDVSELKQSFKPLEVFEQRYRNAAGENAKLLYWYSQIQVFDGIVEGVLAEVEAKVSEGEFPQTFWDKLDEIIALTEFFANELDSWKSSPGHEEVIQAYEDLIEKVQILQDKIDGQN